MIFMAHVSSFGFVQTKTFFRNVGFPDREEDSHITTVLPCKKTYVMDDDRNK